MTDDKLQAARPRQPSTDAGRQLARQSLSKAVTIDQILDIEDEAAALAASATDEGQTLTNPWPEGSAAHVGWQQGYSAAYAENIVARPAASATERRFEVFEADDGDLAIRARPAASATERRFEVFEADDGDLAIRARPAVPEALDVERLAALVKDRWLASVEWDGNGKRASWRCTVCSRYDRHADDACPVDFILAVLSSEAVR